MKTNKFYKRVQSLVGVLALGMLIITPAAFADYIDMEYVNADGQVEPAMLVRVNNNGYAVGLAGTSMVELFANFGVLGQGIDAMVGLVCTDVNTPLVSTSVFGPTQTAVNGVIYSLTSPDVILPLPMVEGRPLSGYAFLPFDINDENTIVGTFAYMTDSGLNALPFLAEPPWTQPTIICGINDIGELTKLPVADTPEYSVGPAFATGINNSGDIVGLVTGGFSTDNFLSLGQGFTFNKAAAGDGLLSVNEFSTFNCGGSLLTFPLSINNSGNITGYTLSLKYSLAAGSYFTDIEDNYVLSDDDVRIPAGEDMLSALGENILKPKYLEVRGFVKAMASAGNDFISFSHVTPQAMAADENAGEVEVYGTIPYAILDSDRVLFAYTNVDPNNGLEDELFTLNDLFAALLYPDQYSVPVNMAGLAVGQSSPPAHDRVLAQGYGFPGATVAFFGDVNTSGTAVGGYVMEGGVLSPYIYTPGVCVEENDGYIDIMGRPSCVTTDLAPLYVPVRVQAAPNEVHALGFEVVYDPNILEFMGFEVDPVDNQYPATLLAGWVVDGQTNWDVSEVGLGLVRVGAYTSDAPIQANSEGILGYLVFNSFSAEVTGLQIQALVDDIDTWTATGACLSKATGDCNDDGVVTPADALCAFEKGLGLCDTSCGPCIEVPSDVDQNGVTDMYDVLCIFKYYLGLPSCLGSGEEPLVF